jgi:hypothetical protein
MKNGTPNYLIDKTNLKQKALTLRIPMRLHDALNALREQADGAGMVFDVQAAVVEALERAVDKASDELQRRQGTLGDVAAPKKRGRRERSGEIVGALEV